LIHSGIYLDFLQKNKAAFKDTNDGDELDFPLFTVLDSVDEEKRNKFNEIVNDAFEVLVEQEHEYLITLLKKKSKPSLLNKVFKNNKAKDTTIVAR
jgi:hypothetical protein